MKLILIVLVIVNLNIYAQQFGFVNVATTNSNVIAHAIARDNSGNLLACGFYSGGPNYEGTVLPGSGSYNGFLAKYDNEGNFLWVQSGFSSSNGEIHDVAVDSDDNIYICGYFRGTSNFDGIADNSPDEQNAFVAKYDSDGNIIWFERFGSTLRNDAVQIVVDSDASVYVAGYYQGTTEFVSSTLTSSGSADVFLIKLDTDGNEVWLKTGVGTQTATSRGLSIDESDNLYWLGDFRTDIDFGGSTLTGNGNNDFFIVKLNKSGSILLEFSEGTSPYETATSIYADENQNIYAVGFIDGNTNFGGINVSVSGVHETVVMKYNSSGVIQWAKNIGGTSNDYPTDVITDSEGNVYVSGQFQGNLSNVNAAVVSSGGVDMFVSRFDSDGNYDWTLTASGGGSTQEQIHGMDIDEYNTLYLFGNISGSVDFSGTVVNSGTGNNVFLASAYELTPAGISTSEVLTDGPFKANGGGNVSSPGNSAITAKGIVWGTTSAPTIALTTKTNSGAGTGSFTGQMTGLVAGTQYYYRAYATNDQGTFYGAELTFFTSSYEIPIDGNQDNYRDTDQNHVNTFLSSNGNNYLTILSVNSMTLNDVSNYNISDDESFVYPFGVTEFKINASQAEVKIYYHGIASLNGYTYRKKFPDGTYREFDNFTYSTEIIGGNRVAVAILSLTDGGPGDYDGIVNGVIYDPGGPALPISANIPIWDWWYALLLIPTIIFAYKKFA